MEKLLAAGMDVARLNFSHGTHAQHAQNIAALRELALRMGRPLAILQDLSGPKVRLGAFAAASIALKRGAKIGFKAEIQAAESSALAAASERSVLILPLPVPA